MLKFKNLLYILYSRRTFNMNKTIYDRIRERRIQLGLSQEDLAIKMGYKSRSTINKIESGAVDIARNKIEKFAEVLNTTPAYLMDWNDTPKEYYIDPEVSKYAQAVKDNPNLRILFDASKDMSKDDIDFVVNMIEGLKKREGK
ncbi:DNA-binding helix-turn-helix protein [Veillonella sp. 3_1_44]|nr:DNA-binding helix-turn-helix protein [Veillonella sp. 3_1_44]